jgi:release factor glutamine methyltransferase
VTQPISEWLRVATKRLQEAGVGTARLDALVLLEDATQKNRSWLLAHPEFVLNDATFHDLEELIARREKHEPLAYIRGKTEFYGREFRINHHVLEPRPESETMIDLLLARAKSEDIRDKKLRIIDVGTGSGALAITAKLELPGAEITAIDIDPSCLAVAQQNAQNLNANITFLQGDLLTPLSPLDSNHMTFLLCNLPYVPDSYHINEAALQEPQLAIFGGEDGLDVYRQLFDQARKSTQCPDCILAESLPFQHGTLAKVARAHGYQQSQENDFIQVFTRQ